MKYSHLYYHTCGGIVEVLCGMDGTSNGVSQARYVDTMRQWRTGAEVVVVPTRGANSPDTKYFGRLG